MDELGLYRMIDGSGMTYIMSRYLPWGEHVVASDIAWKEHWYSTVFYIHNSSVL